MEIVRTISLLTSATASLVAVAHVCMLWGLVIERTMVRPVPSRRDVIKHAARDTALMLIFGMSPSLIPNAVTHVARMDMKASSLLIVLLPSPQPPLFIVALFVASLAANVYAFSLFSDWVWNKYSTQTGLNAAMFSVMNGILNAAVEIHLS